MNTTIETALNTLQDMRKAKLIPHGEAVALLKNLKGEEAEAIAGIIRAAWDAFQKLPKAYETQDLTDPVVYLHYFIGSWDWYITENATEGSGEDVEAFGLVKSECCPEGELGYINIPEITCAGAELDLYFTPAPLSTFRK
jgi:hypothetical protein